MTATDDIDICQYEDTALGQTMPEPLPEPVPITAQPEVCDSLWMPPCPKCSWVALWRRPELDRLEPATFLLARHTSARYERQYYMLGGCSHVTELSLKIGPTQNRLRLAIAWRNRAADLQEGMYQNGYTEAQRAEFSARLGHPTLFHFSR